MQYNYSLQEIYQVKTSRILIIILLLIGIFIGISFYPKPIQSEVNVCLHLSDYDNQTTPFLIDLRVSWVRTDWTTPDESMRNYSQDLQDNNISLLAIIDHKTFGYQIPSLVEWNRTITELATSEDFRSTDAVEIWNEPNSNLSDSSVEPEFYYEMLKSAYTIIKNYTTIPVVFAGVSPNVSGWKTYLNTVFAYGDTQNYFDYMGIHLYDDTTTNLEHLQFVKGLTSKPIWLTETGQPSETDGYTEATQAEYLRSVYSTLEPHVDKIFIYELRDGTGATHDKENYFGLLTLEITKKEAYDTVWKISRNQEKK